MTATELTVTIEQPNALAAKMRDGLVDLLLDAVDAGDSVGFLESVSRDDAIEFWERVFAEVEFGRRLLLVARDGERVVGAVQLSLAQLPNGRHRGEVEKLLVHTSSRRQGLARPS